MRRNDDGSNVAASFLMDQSPVCLTGSGIQESLTNNKIELEN
ncbi:MAG: hypothetical protein ACK5UE_13160 [Chitinophagales bacterium]